MNCPRHPEKRTVTNCKDCGAGFCIECVRETDQTTLCPDCYRRKLTDIAREFAPGEGAAEQISRVSVLEARPSPVSKERPPAPPEERAVPEKPPEPPPVREKKRERPPVRTKPQEAATPPELAEIPHEAKPGKKKFRFGKRKSKGEEPPRKPPEEPPEPSGGGTGEDFLAQGPDDDFSFLGKDKGEVTGRARLRRRTKPPMAKVAEAPPAEAEKKPPAREKAAPARAKAPPPPQPASSEDVLLQDVVSTLISADAVETADAGVLATQEAAVDAGVEAPAEAAVEPAAPKPKVSREERMERWSFISQPRTAEYTIIGTTWWKAALFVAAVLVGGALLWAVVNAYIIPADMEYGIFALIIGLIIGLAYWWRAGKKHGTKLAVQAALTTFFALFIGEFFHWFLIIVKNKAFRTIFFDLISFKFLWQNGAEIMRKTIEAMFPGTFILILVLPTLVAFIIGFGMPPIPEVFFQIGRALKGQSPEKKEAGHGLES